MGNTQQTMREITQKNFKGRDEEDPSFTCEICIEPVPHKKKFKNKNRCAHPFCLDCIAKYIEVEVEDQIAEVKCPGLYCEKLLDPLSCRPILSPKLFEKWCDVLCDSTVLTYDSRAYCPFRGCSALILNECNEVNPRRTKCPNCNNLFCFNCGHPWHEGVQCGEIGEAMRDINEILFDELVERKSWTRCPKCRHTVELASGCLSVKCRCGTRFCHACGTECYMCWCKRSREERNLPLTITIILLFILFYLVFVSFVIH